MRKAILLGLGLVVGLAAGTAAANAAVKAYWDEQAQKWVKYTVDSSGKVTSSSASKTRNVSPIEKQLIDYDGPFRPNTLVINTAERRLYYVFAPGKAWKYGIGVGREGFQWAGADWISSKAEWPGWTPPPEMVQREKAKGRILPAYMPGGPTNPLGARALYIGSTMYRIHGSNEPWTIGQAVSSGCIRMVNDDVIDLYSKVKVGTRVVVLSGNESAARLASLAVPPAPKKAKPTIVEARAKDDSVPADMTGSVPPSAEAAPATDTAPVTETAPSTEAAVSSARPDRVADAAEAIPAPVESRTGDTAPERRVGH